ncbi:HNH endonuclease [Sinorhizobium phage phiM9]|uniref:Putative homing endonuclease n=1 Tax=Sinorhizobium phage phiM9 TaxID=1636182 RepID=A0A0F6R7E4_9CAUD|nr:HNH endonuclease [Sinorhizobium phage phiM9]AKE44688.1 putative homing endonuclease [Sinorhizobium phage phiM9]
MSSNLFLSSRIDASKEWCVYVIIYLGDKMPPFYAGFTRVSNMIDGYHGSVSSEEWEEIWRSEINQHPQLFRRKIIRTFSTKKEASDFEIEFLTHFDARRSHLFVNKTNGAKNFCGNIEGNKHSEETKIKISEGNRGKQDPRIRKGRLLRAGRFQLASLIHPAKSTHSTDYSSSARNTAFTRDRSVSFFVVRKKTTKDGESIRVRLEENVASCEHVENSLDLRELSHEFS